LFSLDALWHGRPGGNGSTAWLPDPQSRTHFFDAGMVWLLQGKDPAAGISSATMRAGKQQRRRPAKVFSRTPARDAAAVMEVEVEVEVGPDVNPEPEGGRIDPAYFNSSPAYKRKVRRHTSSRFGNVPKGVLDAENSLSAVSCKGASLQDRLGFVSMFAKVGPGQSCAAW
jgi:hypothetical protein